MIGVIFLFGSVRIGLVFRSISNLILLIQSRYHLIGHHKSATASLKQQAITAQEIANKSRRERMH